MKKYYAWKTDNEIHIFENVKERNDFLKENEYISGIEPASIAVYGMTHEKYSAHVFHKTFKI